jgi:hypothetical protein
VIAHLIHTGLSPTGALLCRIIVAGTYLGALSVPSSSKPASRLTSSSNSSEVQPTTRKNSQPYTRQEIVNGVCNRRIDRIYPRIWWITLWKKQVFRGPSAEVL